MMMYPAYMWTDSSYPPHTDPRSKQMIPSHMPPSPYQPWPYPVPHQYHGCCNHNTYYAPCPYTFQPHYTHCPPPPPFNLHPHGVYPPFPASYSLLPQHYSVEQPKYEYDKNTNHHCCGCNHNHNHKEDEKRPMIKEESQVDNKTSDSQLPLLLKDRPDYPVMWIPSGYMSNAESKENEKDNYSHEPVSLKHHEPLKRGGDGEIAHDEKSEDGNRFPFKIFWLPSKDDQVRKDTKEDSLDIKADKRLPDEKTAKNNDGSGSEGECETSGKHAAPKVFPVKQASANEQTGSKHAVHKVIPVKQASTNEEKKKNLKSIDTMVSSDSVEKADNESRASPKTSKLPPVCLRVDPLPKKKKSSRSPSPGGKERSNGSNGSPVNSPKSSDQQPQVLKISKDEQSEGDIKTVDHANKVERANLADLGGVQRGKGDENEKGRVVEKKNMSEKGDESEKGKIEAKKNLSEHEAALIIQSVYRGFEVRKSQPLKKLRQISEVKKQVSDLRNRIQDLETSSSNIRIDSKKQVIIGETIMSLLLKLDTIQGLHPFVREVRKSVAKELVGLQEKLDSITCVKSETPSGLCENYENKCAESQYDDDAEACNTACNTGNVEQQLEKSTEDDAIHDKFDQAPTGTDAVVCENHEAEAAVPQECCNTIGEPQLELHIEKIDQALSESDAVICENHEVEGTVSQEVCNTTREPQSESHIEKIEQAPTECDEALRVCQNHDVEAAELHKDCASVGEPELGSHKYKSDQALPTENDEAQGLCESHEATESQEGGPQLELHKEKSDQAPNECDEHQEKFDQEPTECGEALGLLKENHEVEATESQEGCNIIGEPQSESHIDQAPTECDEALGLHMENHEVEATESRERHNTAGESHEDKSNQAASKCDSTDEHEAEATDNGGVKGDDMKVEDNTREPNKNQLEIPVEDEDLANVESMMHDPGDKNAAQTGNISMVSEAKDEEAPKANEGEKHVSSGGDGRLREENEKLRVAVEELMKAGNEQLGVIRELTGRVKDLEKKLSKKKKKVKVNKSRRSRDCVV